MAVFSAIALLVALGLAALLSLQPWATSSVSPQLRVAPDLGVGLGDAVVVSGGRQPAVAPTQPAAGAAPRLAAAGATVDEGESRPQMGVAAARAVTSPSASRPPVGSPGPAETEPAPEAKPAPPPAVVPVAAPAPPSAPVAAAPIPIASGSGSPGPVGAGAGPPVGGVGPDVTEVHDGDERALAFSFYVQPTAFRAPGEESLIVQFRGDGSESPTFALQLWDDGAAAQRGLWASGDAMGGERFLAPVEEGVWHEAVICFQASDDGDGFYVLLLDGQPIDARSWVSLIDSASGNTRLEVGLFREGEPVTEAADVLFGPTRLGDTLESVLP